MHQISFHPVYEMPDFLHHNLVHNNLHHPEIPFWLVYHNDGGDDGDDGDLDLELDLEV
jgi:hypothetical protein